MKQTTPSRRAFTVVELLITLAVTVVVLAIMVVLGTQPRHPGGARQMKDGTQIRGIHQALIMWSGNHQDRFPVPSLLDAADDTIAPGGPSKDTTANIISILINSGFMGPEICVSPAEASSAIKCMTNYAYKLPPTAAVPTKALWDPTFSSDFTPGHTSNFSYAHLYPAGPRAAQWTNSFNSGDAIIGNRGPMISSIVHGKGTTTIPAAPKLSNTYLIHGGRTTWEGTVLYNDNHANFETSMMPSPLAYNDAAKHTWEDCLFCDEPDDALGTNAYLTNYIAGSTPGSVAPIWD